MFPHSDREHFFQMFLVPCPGFPDMFPWCCWRTDRQTSKRTADENDTFAVIGGNTKMSAWKTTSLTIIRALWVNIPSLRAICFTIWKSRLISHKCRVQSQYYPRDCRMVSEYVYIYIYEYLYFTKHSIHYIWFPRTNLEHQGIIPDNPLMRRFRVQWR